VDALGGAPGIHAARWGGPGPDMAQRRRRLLAALGERLAAERRARFRCVVAVAVGERVTLAEGSCEGRIAPAEQPGSGGFGYDAIFIPEGAERCWSQLTLAEKNRLSHRGQAVARIVPALRRLAAG